MNKRTNKKTNNSKNEMLQLNTDVFKFVIDLCKIKIVFFLWHYKHLQNVVTVEDFDSFVI